FRRVLFRSPADSSGTVTYGTVGSRKQERAHDGYCRRDQRRAHDNRHPQERAEADHFRQASGQSASGRLRRRAGAHAGAHRRRAAGLGLGLTWVDVGLFVAFYFFGAAGITVGYHRHLTHGSFKAKPWLRALLAIAGSTALQGPPLTWVADHRRHHAYSDRE